MAIHFDDVQGDVASIFLAYFQRAPEFEAMQHYVGVLQGYLANPQTEADAFKLLSAQIYADGVGAQEVPAGPTITDFWYVNYLYSNVLGRNADPDGLEYWVTQLESGNIERAELVGVFVASALGAGGRDEAYVQNRTFVAVEFAQWENSNPQVLPTLTYNAAEVMMGVNEDMATVYAAQSRLETTTGQIGETYRLTPNIDTLEGTSANDVFNAVYENIAGVDRGTLTAFDTIDGGLGTDTLNIFVLSETVNGYFPENASVRNVEIINIYDGGNAREDGPGEFWWEPDYFSLLDVSNYEGVQQFWQIGSENDVSNVGEGVVVGFRDITNMWADVTLADGVNAATVVVENVGNTWTEPELEVHGNALDTVTIRGSLRTNEDHLDLNVAVGQGVRKITIDSTVDFHLNTDASRDNQGNVIRLNNIDMSASIGDAFYLIDGWEADEVATSGLTVTLGSGNDVIIFGEDRALGLSDNIDGGEGFDVLGLNITGKVQTQTYDAIARTSNFEGIVFYSENFWVGFDDDDDLVTTSTEIDIAQLEGFDLVGVGGGTEFRVANLTSDVTLEIFSHFDDGLMIMSPGLVWLDKASADVNIMLDDSISVLGVGEVGAKGGTLNLDGEGIVVFSNATSGKFNVIDASDLQGLNLEDFFEAIHDEMDIELDDLGEWAEVLIHHPTPGLVLLDVAGLGDGWDAVMAAAEEDGLLSSGMSGAVAETVILGSQAMNIVGINVKLTDAEDAGDLLGDLSFIANSAWVSQNSSTYGNMDVIEGFKSTGEVRDILLGYGTAGEVKLGANVTTLQLAFAAAAAAYETADDDVLYFVFDGDTYLFADTVDGNTGQYDNADFALKIAGVHNMENAWGYQWVVEAHEDLMV